jgi:hypothetical protein
MSALLLHAQATVLCTHGGQAKPTRPSTRVQLGGQPAVTVSAAYVVTGCPLPPNAGGPCLSAQWTVAATRVLIDGAPALLMDSSSTCVPTGAPLNPVNTQLRVQGT